MTGTSNSLIIQRAIDRHLAIPVDLKQTPGIIAQLVSNCVCRISITGRGNDPN